MNKDLFFLNLQFFVKANQNIKTEKKQSVNSTQYNMLKL